VVGGAADARRSQAANLPVGAAGRQCIALNFSYR